MADIRQITKKKKLVADHDMWLYFTTRFGLETSIFLEPKPGVNPTTKHLISVIKKVKSESIAVLIQGAYFNKKHAEFPQSVVKPIGLVSVKQ